jgi:hypothetical protein
MWSAFKNYLGICLGGQRKTMKTFRIIGFRSFDMKVFIM